MIEEQVVVTSLTPEGAWIEGVQQSACGSCSAKAGCGQHALSQLGRKVSLWLPNEGFDKDGRGESVSLRVGQQIVVGLPEGAILRSTLVLYGVPLFTLVIGAVLGNVLGGELGSIILSVLSIFLGFQIARKWSDQNKSHWQPRYIRACDSSSSVKNYESLITTDKV